MALHGGQKAPITGIDNRCRRVVGADHIEAANLPLNHIIFELRIRFSGHTNVHAKRQQRAGVIRIYLGVPAIVEHILSAPLIGKILDQVVDKR